MGTRDNPYPIQSYYFFQSNEPDPIRAFEKQTQFRVNHSDVYVIPISTLEKAAEDPKKAEKSWWNSFWQDGWSHLTFGTVSIGFGIGFLCLATGPAGWITGVLAMGGGAVSVFSGGAQLYSTDPETKKLYAQLGDASLSLNNMPGFAVGTATYMLTGNFGRSIDYANYAGLFAGGSSLVRSGMRAVKMQRMYNLEVGLNSTRYGSRTRAINAYLMNIDPAGLEASHLIPQRVLKVIIDKVPKHRRSIENLGNGPLGINFLTPVQHALVDPYRFRTLPVATKEALALSDPFRTIILQNYPKLAQIFGFVPNMSPTARPMFNSLVITGGRTIKTQATDSSDK